MGTNDPSIVSLYPKMHIFYVDRLKTVYQESCVSGVILISNKFIIYAEPHISLINSAHILLSGKFKSAT